MTTYFDAHGREVDDAEALDARGCLKNGFGMRVPLQLCDTMQKDIAEFAERHHKRFDAANASDAANGFFDSRGIWFPPDQRLVDAQRVAEYLAGRDEAMRQQWLNGRRAVNDARKEMIDAASSALRQSNSAPSADVTPQRPISFADALRIKDEAYRAMVEEMQNAWRTRNGTWTTLPTA